MDKTLIPCEICYELLVYDNSIENFVCKHCGPFACIFLNCETLVPVEKIVCDHHKCDNPLCDPTKNHGDYLCLSGKLHVTTYPKPVQDILLAKHLDKGISCPNEAVLCRSMVRGFTPAKDCRFVFRDSSKDTYRGKRIHSTALDVCPPCWQKNKCKSVHCPELRDPKGVYCPKGLNACFVAKTCKVCTVNYQTDLVKRAQACSQNTDAWRAYLCSDCITEYYLCLKCKTYGLRKGCAQFSKYVFKPGQELAGFCIYCCEGNTLLLPEQKKVAYLIGWRLMKAAALACIERNVKLSQRFPAEYARWFFWNRDIITSFEIDNLVHNHDVVETMKSIISDQKRVSTMFLMYCMSTLPPHLFLRIIQYIYK